MNYEANTTYWKRGDIVIHDADRKSKRMLMKVIGFTRDDRVKTKYLNQNVSKKTYDNPMDVLHDPARFDIDTETI